MSHIVSGNTFLYMKNCYARTQPWMGRDSTIVEHKKGSIFLIVDTNIVSESDYDGKIWCAILSNAHDLSYVYQPWLEETKDVKHISSIKQ